MSAASILEGHGFDRYRPLPKEPEGAAEPGICVLCRETGPLEFRLIAARATDDTRATARTLLRRPAAGEQTDLEQAGFEPADFEPAEFALIAPVRLAEERDAILALLAPHLTELRPLEPPASDAQASSIAQRPRRRRGGGGRFPAGGSRRTSVSGARRSPPAA